MAPKKKRLVQLGVSGSRVERAMKCVGSVVYPPVETIVDDKANDPASKGTAVHAYLCDVSKVGREKALEAVPAEFIEQCACIDLDQIPTLAGGYTAEVAIAYDVKTGAARLIGYNVGRNYGVLGEWEIATSIDSLGVSEDSVVLWDVKTGWADPPPPEDNWQLTTGALAARSLYGRQAAIVGIIRVPAFRSAWSRSAPLDAFTLDERDGQLTEMAERIYEAREALSKSQDIPLTTGSHCNYCPALSRCPAQTRLVRALIAEPSTILPPQMTVEMASAAWEKIAQMRKVLDLAEKQVRAFAAANTIPLSGGKVLGTEVSTSESLDGEATYRVISDVYGQEVARQAVDVKATKTSVERAIKALVAQTPGAKFAPALRSALEHLRAGGAVKTSTSESVTVHNP
jgi:hypothetical protein